MFYKNAKIYTKDFQFLLGAFAVENEIGRAHV